MGKLAMRDVIGSLFSGFSSVVSVENAMISNVTVSARLLYLAHCNASISNSVIQGLALGETGSFATVLSQSTLLLHSVSLQGIVGIEHGAISLRQSSLLVSSSSFSAFNISVIIAQHSNIALENIEVEDVHYSATDFLSMVPNGAVLSCFNCPKVVISKAICRDLDANMGGVVYAYGSDEEQGSIVEVDNSVFQRCVGRTNGGVISTEKCNVTITNCIFDGNSARYGGVVHFHSESQLLLISNSAFFNNTAIIAGACIFWIGRKPIITQSRYTNNSALYGSPLASLPHHFLLLSPESLTPLSEFPLQGVTGQHMKTPLLVGVFDILGQLIVTDNATFVSVVFPAEVKALGSKRAVTLNGIVSFAFTFSAFTTDTFNFTLYSPGITNFIIAYQFRDCQPGEIRSETGCFPCPKSSYSLNPSDSRCSICPAHAQCLGRTELVIDAEYWRASNSTDHIYTCLVPGACRAGEYATCAPGYRGALCNACAYGYYRYAGWSCRNCNDEVPFSARGFIAAVLVLVIIAPFFFFLRTNHPLWCKIALILRLFLQYAYHILYASLLHSKWGFATLIHHQILRVIGSFGSLLLYSDCQVTDAVLKPCYFQVIVLTCYPILLVISCALLWGIGYFTRLRGNAAMLWGASCVAVYHFLPMLWVAVVGMLQCKQVQGENWLVADMTELCWQGNHLLYATTLAALLIFTLLICHTVAVFSILKSPKCAIFQHFRTYLTSGYKQEQKHWEINNLIRRALMALLSLSYPYLDYSSACLLFICILGFSLQSDIKNMPYQSLALNIMNIMSYLTTVVLATLSMHLGDLALSIFASLGTAVMIILAFCAAKRSSGLVKYEEKQAIYMMDENSMENLNPPYPSLEISKSKI